MADPIIWFSDRLHEIIDDINGPVAEAMLKMLDGNYLTKNTLKINRVDVSKTDWNFDITIGGEKDEIPINQRMKVGKFIRHFFGSTFTEKQIYDFTMAYNNLKKGLPVSTQTSSKTTFKKIDIPEFSFNPKDVRSTFLSLTTKTYPHGHEEEVLKFLPSLEKDQFGNYFKIIGKSETMFTSHLDTADRQQKNVTVYSNLLANGDEMLITDNTSILGADDKSGVSVMLYMMAHNIPGVYYFFIGEERGGIGSHLVAGVFDTIEHLRGIKRCVSFDRRNYHSIITHQLGRQCCSEKFAQSLADELNKSGLTISLDSTGVYTDSASFIDEIPECTNISVGYFSEHTHNESQNITFLEKLAKACTKVNWESLPTVKKIGFDDAIMRKYKTFISDFKSTIFNLETKMVDEYGTAFIRIDVDDPDPNIVHQDLKSIESLLNKHNMDPDIRFDDNYIKIELK
jgi:hypothetical protein